MVRLQPSDDLTEGTSSSDTSIGSKRSRPVSSLDYKASSSHREGGTKLVVDDPNWDDPTKEDPRGATSNAQSSAKKQNMAFPLMGMNPTRARGSSGFLPPPKPSLKDIESMTQEEIMEMIMNDPELSAKFAAQQKASQQKEKFSSESQSHQQRGSSRRSTNQKKSTPIKSSKDRIELLKEQGIPYEQWTILLVLLLFSLYQLYKWMQPPPSKSQRMKAAAAQRLATVNDDIVAAELEDAVAKATSAGANKKSNRKKKATSAPKASTAPKKSTPLVESPVKVPRAPAADAPVIIDEVPLDDDSWKPVVKNKPHHPKESVAVTAEDAITVHTANTSKTKKKPKKSNAAIPSLVETVQPPPVVEATKPETTEAVAVATTPAEEEVIPVNGTAEHVSKDDDGTANGPEEEEESAPATGDVKKKKLKKKKPKNGTASTTAVPTSDAVVDADAILAQQLQYEEDQLAASSEAATTEETPVNGTKPGEEDNWAEVTKKKKSAPVAPEATSTDLETEDA